VILAQNKCEGRFAIDRAKAGRALRLTPGELLELVNQVLACEWVRVSSNRIELTAAGINVAKACLRPLVRTRQGAPGAGTYGRLPGPE